MNKADRFIPVNKWQDHHDWPKEGGLRNLIFNAKHNGFSMCIKKVGKRVLIDEQAFFEWIKTNPKFKLTKP